MAVLKIRSADAWVEVPVGVDDHGDLAGLADPDHAIIADADGDTKVDTEESANENIVRIDTGGTERVTIDDVGLFVKDGHGLIIGHTAQIAATDIPELQVLGTGSEDAAALCGRFSADSGGPALTFVKSRNAAIGSHTIVQDNDTIGIIGWLPDDGVDYDTVAATFEAQVDDASPAAGDIGMAFVWRQSPGGGAGLPETMRLTAAGQLELPTQGVTGGLLIGTDVSVFRSAANTLRLDSGVSNAFMTLNGTTQAFGSAIVEVQFLNAVAVDFTNVAGFELVRFSDASVAGGPAVEFATGVLNVNEDIDISGHIALGASASIDTKAGAVLVLTETSTATASRAGADGLIFQLNIAHTYTPAATSSSAFRGLFMDVQAGGDQDVDGVFLAGAGALQFVCQHDSDGDINTIQGAAGQCIVGNNPLDAESSKTPHLDFFGSQGIGLEGVFIWSSHLGYDGGDDALQAGAFQSGVKALRGNLILGTMQDALDSGGGSNVLTLPDAFILQLNVSLGNQTTANRITVTNLTLIELGIQSIVSTVTITNPISFKIEAWPSDPTYTNGPHAIVQEGVSDGNWLGGYTYVGGASLPALTTIDNAALTVDQDASGGAIPVLTLDQADVSEEMIEFITTIGTGNAIEAIGAKTLTTTHFVKVTIPGGLTRYIPVGTIA